jgi:hypothetical protein
VKAALVVLVVLLTLKFPVPAVATATTVLAVAATVITHPLVILLAELGALAVIAAGIARAAGVTIPSNWRYST